MQLNAYTQQLRVCRHALRFLGLHYYEVHSLVGLARLCTS